MDYRRGPSHPHPPGRCRPLFGGRRRARRAGRRRPGAPVQPQLEATPLLAGLDQLPADSILHTFHPAVASWFRRRFPSGPTEPQRQAWPHIRSGNDVLVASPTGTGKTLTGFLVAIDAAYRAQVAGGEAAAAKRSGPGVIYVSPLRALAVDVHENLQVPLAGIAEEAERLGMASPDLTIAVRTGDTPPSERAAMRRSPPDLLVTTPESLYLLLTAASSRTMLQSAHTVVVDEVHTLARDKRGSHLALSLERLSRLTAEQGVRLQRIGLSATQRPLEVVARLLSGVDPGRPPTTIIDCGHQRHLDVDIELPGSELEAVASGQQMGDVLDRIAAHVLEHRTTLVFVNTRKMAERVAHQLALRLGSPDAADRPTDDGLGTAGGAIPEVDRVDAALQVAAHHGSLSAARRRIVEQRLRAGDLRALVATASLELGIDVGPVELVCQIGSPRAIGTFLQRVGRANHHREGTPAGRLYPLTRDELVECTALLAGVRAGHLDVLHPPTAPLDVLAQQVVAEVAANGEWEVGPLYDLVRGAAPYADLTRQTFDEVVDMVSWGIPTGRGRRGAHLHHDAVNGRLRPRRGARLAALTSGGAIPETGDYRVVLDPDGVTVGSVHEDFAVEATAGDIFLLGTHSWRVVKVETGTVRVHDAGDLPPTIPFWLGEAPARTAELSAEVGALRAELEPLLGAGDGDSARQVVRRTAGVSEEVATQVVAYLGAGLAALGALPTRDRLVIERVFDESEGTQLIVHSPYGGRINRAFGLALRKRFCVSFDFELQAAADDDTVVLSLGPQHSFPLSQVPTMLHSGTVTDVLTQAVLPHPMLAARWRWNLNRALVVPRSRGGQRRPIHLQRMEADDLLAAAWPALAACQENAGPGPVPVPDHVLVRQTVDDCLTEPLDADGLSTLLAEMEAGRVGVHLVESAEASPLAHGILSGRPYTFLDGAPLEERRTRAVPLARGLGPLGPNGLPSGLPVDPSQLGPLDPGAVAEVLDQARPRPRDADELHELLCSLILCRPVDAWREWFEQLEAEGRASRDRGCVDTDRTAGQGGADRPLARRSDGRQRRRGGRVHRRSPRDLRTGDRGTAGGRGATPDRLGPRSTDDRRAGPHRTGPSGRRGIGHRAPRRTVVRPPPAGTAPRRQPQSAAAAHRTSQRRRLRPVSGLLATRRPRHAGRGASRAAGRHRATAGTGGGGGRVGTPRPAGPGGRLRPPVARRAVLGRRSGMGSADAPSGARPGRSRNGGDRRRRPRSGGDRRRRSRNGGDRSRRRTGPVPFAAGTLVPTLGRRGSATPSPATPLAIVTRPDLSWMLAAVRADRAPNAPTAGASADILGALRQRGACFRSELATATGRLSTEVDEGLWDLVARGVVTADAFSAVRSLLATRRRQRSALRRRSDRRVALGRQRSMVGSGVGEGRWSLLPEPEVFDAELASGPASEEMAEAVAWQLLARWGVVAWELWSRESYRVPWRDVIRALRRFEARGQVMGGRFVAGMSGEQYALPEAVALLADVRREPTRGDDVVVAGADPLNLTGEWLGGVRVPAVRHRTVHYRDGVPAEPSLAARTSV